MQVPHHYTPRPYQARHLVDIRDKWFVVMKWPRRAGKGLTTFVYAIQRMVEQPMGVVIIYPTAEQGYRSFWNNVENDGFKTIEHAPKELVSSINSTRDVMSMTLKNGSTLDLVGANANPEKLRGNNTKLYILSEFVDINAGVLDIIEPIVIANGGQIIIESTPKQDGVSGMTFAKLFKAAEKDPKQHASTVDAREYMSEEQLERARQSCINKWGNDFMFRQEYLLDDGQALESSYYGNIITTKEKDGAIGLHPYDPSYPVYTSWDLGGGGDSTAGIFWQYHNHELTIIDAYDTHTINDAVLVQYIRSKPYNYAWHFFPHDGAKRDSDGIQRLVKLQQLGLINSSLLNRRSKEAGLTDAIHLLAKNTTRFHRPFTERLLDQLRLYKRKYNQYTGDYEGPEHKTESHFADAIRYCSDAVQQYFKKDGSFIIESQKTLTSHNIEQSDDDAFAEVSWDF